MRTRGRQSRPKVAKVGSKGHFWSASASLFEDKVAPCCLCKKHTIYYVLTTLAGSGHPLLGSRRGFATSWSYTSFFSPLFRPPGTPRGTPRQPKWVPRPLKATPKAPQNRLKIAAGTHLGAQAAQEVQKGTRLKQKWVQNRYETCFASTPGYEEIRNEDVLIIDYISAAALRMWKKIRSASPPVFNRKASWHRGGLGEAHLDFRLSLHLIKIL